MVGCWTRARDGCILPTLIPHISAASTADITINNSIIPRHRPTLPPSFHSESKSHSSLVIWCPPNCCLRLRPANQPGISVIINIWIALHRTANFSFFHAYRVNLFLAVLFSIISFVHTNDYDSTSAAPSHTTTTSIYGPL